MTMSVLGHYNNFFFAAHLLDIAMGFKTLRTILSSVTHNGKQVMLSFLSLTTLSFKTKLVRRNNYTNRIDRNKRVKFHNVCPKNSKDKSES